MRNFVRFRGLPAIGLSGDVIVDRCQILGVTIANETIEAAFQRIAALIDGEGPRSLYFVNAHTLNNACEDSAYRAILNRADVVYGDGTGVRWAARGRGVTLLDNVNGTDLVPMLLSRGSGIRCYLVGSAPERIETIRANAQTMFPGVDFVGAHHGYIDAAASEAVLADIRRCGANLVLVGMGNPLQEKWIDRHRAALPSALTVAVGGLFEYWGGGLVRAPRWMRSSGIEWVHLMLRQPWKARRYLIGNPVFMYRMFRTAAAERRVGAVFERGASCQATALQPADGSPKRAPEASSVDLAASCLPGESPELKSAS